MPAQAAPAFAALDATVLAAFGEPCWFYPKVGDAREVSATVDHVTSTADERGIYLEERLEVLVSRSATTGIDRVEIGEGFRRDTDPEGAGFAFSGEVIDVSDSAWKLAFTRRSLFQTGGNNIR